ncbi:MAG: cytidine deaminase [Acidiferrobacter sp.]
MSIDLGMAHRREECTVKGRAPWSVVSEGIAVQEVIRLRAAAEDVMARAYAPYSRFPVGAAVLTASHEIFVGCNVENAAFPVGMCAEATALGAMVAALGRTPIRAALVVVAGPTRAWPCGACRQRLQEFALADTMIYATSLGGELASCALAELLPFSFGPDNLLSTGHAPLSKRTPKR